MDRHPTVGGIEDLLERSGELARIDELIAIATGGDGRFLVIQGRSGIGKTALLAALTRRARRAGMSVYTARCSELEADFAFGTVRQLFEPVVQVMDDDRAEGALVGAAALAGPVVGATEAVTAGGQFAALHGLYWLAADLSARSPLVLAVDDVQWSDLPSLRWLSYLLLRLEGLPILVAVTARVVRSGGQASVLARIMAKERVDLMELAPLGEQSIAALLSAALADEPEPAFTAACRRATDGNPFALQSVIRELATRRVRPIATSASALEYAPAPIARRVIASLTELGEPGRRLASAVAVLGDGAELRLVAELTDLDEATAASIADRLTAADLLANEHPLRFRHPLLRAAVYDDVPLALRSQLHRRAADFLAREQAEPEAIAAHVLRTDPMEEATAVQRLRAAAAVALGRGAPEAATAYLRRALAEPPGRGTRAGLLAELGKAELVAGDRRAVEHLEQAIAECPDPVARATVRGNLAEALRAAGQRRRSLHERLTALQEIGDREPEVAARLEVRVVSMRFTARYAATDVEPAQRLRELARDGGAGSVGMRASAVAAGRIESGGAPVRRLGARGRRLLVRRNVGLTGSQLGRLRAHLC